MKLTERHADRHPSTVQILRWLEPNPALPEPARAVAVEVEALADEVVIHCPDGPELIAGLRFLLQAKDCFVRQVLAEPE